MRQTIDKQGRHRDGTRSSPMGGKAPIGTRTDGGFVPAFPPALGNHALSRFVQRDRDTNQPHARFSTAAATDGPKPLGVQAKLNVSQPEDECEREADDVAQSIMRQGKNGVTHPRLRHESDFSGESRGTPAIDEALQSGGHPLDASTLAFMSRSGAGDFGHVRVHSDERAGDAAASINARAFTERNHIVFGRGEYTPRTDSGRLLLAHELAHTVQQTGAGHLSNSTLMRKPAEPKVVPRLKSDLLAGNEELEAVNRGESTIHLGSRGEAVLRIQVALRADNATALAERSADRRYGTETRAAVIAYQRAHGLEPDGVVGRETLHSLDETANSVIAEVPKIAPLNAKEQFGISVGRADHDFTDLIGLLPGVSKEHTFIERKFPPTVTAAGTLYRKLSLVGSAELSPVKSFATLSKSEMTLEFEKFGTSLTFKQGKSLNDVTFSSPGVELGKSIVTSRSKLIPPTITAIFALPKELILGNVKLKGELRLELEFKLIPKQPSEGMPERRKDIPSPSDWIGVGSFLLALILVLSGRGILFEPSIMETPMKGPALIT